MSTSTCMFRGIGKPPYPPECTNSVRLDEAPYCDEHRCRYQIGDDPRCPDPKGEGDSEYCQRHRQTVSTLQTYRLRTIGPDAPIVTHANGARESHAPHAFTSIDALALFRVAEIQYQGDQKYGPDNWRRIPSETHVNHALAHLFGHLAGDTSDDHLGHATVRIMFALATQLRPDYYGKDTDAHRETE